jgi:FKBP-type peptidyl-prolyl cis-trans isomerase
LRATKALKARAIRDKNLAMRRRVFLSASLVALLSACQAPPEATPDTATAEKKTPGPGGSTTTMNTQGATPTVRRPPPAPPATNDIPAPADVAAAPADAETSSTGLASKVQTKGTGTKHPAKTDKVLVHYTGWTKDGKMFDSSVARGEPISFPLDGVIAGWTEGVQLMVEGEKRRFWIPAKLAYGDNPSPGMPAGQLTFDVELLKILAPPEVPADVAAPPKDATKLPSGLAFKVIQKGTGTAHPAPTDKVKVDYTGWTKDGKMFDSSVTRGQPATFPLNRVIKGWTEGLQQMVVGEKTRFWIPADLAYGDNPGGGKPSGQLTFDVELLQIN